MDFVRHIRAGVITLATLSILAPNPALARSGEEIMIPIAPREIINPYKTALQCLATQLTDEQKATSIAVGYMVDRTGKDSYSQEGASGKFLGQGAEDMLINDLASTGMKVVGFNPVFRNGLDWTLPKLISGGATVAVTLPDVIVEGSFSTFDFGSSDVKELYIFGIGGGKRAYSIRYSMDIRATSMPGGKWPGGEVLATLALEKNVIGREKRGGIASFFGGLGDKTYIEFNLNTQKRELLQYSQRFMVSRAAFGIVANLWDITACDEHLAYSDNLVSGKIQTDQTIP